MGKNFRETLNEQLRDPEFKAEWDSLEPERQIMRAILEGRDERDLTQKQLAEVTGIAQADISRVLYFFVVGKKVILTNGFVKKTSKTPPREIDRAKRYRADYQQRKED